MKTLIYVGALYFAAVGAAELLYANSGSGANTGIVAGVAGLPSVGSMLPGNTGIDDLLIGAGLLALGYYVL